MKYSGHRTGFTLIELSIVLVIIGLIVGGVVVGQAMIKNAKIQETIKSSQQFSTAVQTFRGKYNALPGDMINATQFWGAAAGVDAPGYDEDCASLDNTSPSTGTETCNGNGDGAVKGKANGADYDQYYESFRFWQHLTNDGMLPGHYVGVSGPANSHDYVPGWNSPLPRFSSATWTAIGYNVCWSGNASMYDGCQGNVFGFRNSDETTFPVITALDAYSIDAKIDDGRPSGGKVRSYKAVTNPGCTTSDVDADALYNTTNSDIACSLIFTNAY